MSLIDDAISDPHEVSLFDCELDMEGLVDAEPPASVAQRSVTRVADQLLADDDLGAADLIEVLAHCRSTVAAAQFRMLQAVSLIHDERTEDYIAEMSELVAECAEQDPRSRFTPDGTDRTVAEVGAVLSVSAAGARKLIRLAHAARYRLPQVAATFSWARIDMKRFEIAVAHTVLVNPDKLEWVDGEIARAIDHADHMSIARFTTMVDSIVSRIDSEAIAAQAERAHAERNVTIRPDRFTPGQSRISARVPAMAGAEFDARLTALADAVHEGDPRTKAQRRADALIALGAGQVRLTCLCDDCVAAPAPEAAVSEDAEADSVESGHSDCTCACDEHRASVVPVGAVIHVVANESTLAGDDDAPGYLDGHGIIDADSVRALADRDFVQRVGVSAERVAGGLSALRYRPGKRVQAFIRTGELCCCWPGCNNAVWTVDLDHTVPFDHDHPTRGGATREWNLKPLCRFHHRIKTFGAWRDFQDRMGMVVFESPTGHLFIGNAFTGTDVFPRLRPKPPDHPSRAELEKHFTDRRSENAAAQRKWDEQNPPPF